MILVKRMLVLISASLTFSQSATADDWFMITPLTPVYSALAADNTQLAWQELLLALSRDPQPEKHWAKARLALISKFNCGKQLAGEPSLNQHRHIRLMIQKKTNLAQQSFQLKVSLEETEKPVAISFRDQQGREWLSGNTSEPEQGYVELESDDLVTAPTPGFYQLTIDKLIYPIILPSDVEPSWIQVNRGNAALPISIRTPKILASCPAADMRWQWFDSEFNMLGGPQIIQLGTPNSSIEPYREALSPEPFLNHAKWLSAVVSRSEYQGTVKVEYAQRFALPSKIK